MSPGCAPRFQTLRSAIASDNEPKNIAPIKITKENFFIGSKLLKNFHLLLKNLPMLFPRVTAIYIYPIKSMGAISLPEAAVEMRGLQHDRRYMLVDSNGCFLTQRTTPALGKFQLRYNPEGTGFLVDFLGETLSIPFSLGDDSLVGEARIWDDTVSVFHAATPVNDWFSEKLQQPVSLVYLPDESSRPLPEKHQPNPSNSMHVSLADGYPILVISEASLLQL
ncbi:MAG: hypothetical protein FJ333_07025, partial [Sphingomonadales bacterium]|nr:hypothetical protein [Sphingomonadales bacterium]